MSREPVDIVLIYPKSGVDFGASVAPPFSLLTIAAPVHRQGLTVKIIDQRVDQEWSRHLEEALKSNPICCGISTMTGKQIYFALEAAKIIRTQTKGSVPIVWGGVHPTLLPQQALENSNVDIVCVGEGEETFLDLVDALREHKSLNAVKGIAFLDKERFVFTGPQSPVDIEKMLPTPWDLIDVESYIHPHPFISEAKRVLDIGQSSRGCPYRCTFCYNSAVSQNRWRAMSAPKTLSMIRDDANRFKLDGVWLRDDEFFLDMKRVQEICAGMIELNIPLYTSGARVNDILRASHEQLLLIKQSGMSVMRFGAESGSNRILKYLKKDQTVEQILEVNQRCREAGIKPIYSLMCAIPTETFKEVDQTLDLFFRLQKENPQASLTSISQFLAFPGTAIYDTALRMGLKPPQKLEDWADWSNTDTDFKGVQRPWLSKRQRVWLGNLSYMSNIAYSGAEIFSTMENKPMNGLVNLGLNLLSRYFKWRLKNKSYHFVPEISAVLWVFRLYTGLLNKKSS